MPRSWLLEKPFLRESATARTAEVPRALLAAGVLAFLLLFSGHAGHARDPLSGDVQRVNMIGFTVADIDREVDFFTKVLQFEKDSDFRVVGSNYGQDGRRVQREHAHRPFEAG